MATGTVTTTLKNTGVQCGLIASGTATTLQGNNATANLRIASGENLGVPATGGWGALAFGLVLVTSATGTNPAGDFCWGAIEAGFMGADGVTPRYYPVCAPRGIEGNLAADNVVVTQCVYGPHLTNAGAQVTTQIIFGTNAPTFNATTGVIAPAPIPMMPDVVRVAFFASHVGAPTGNWNLQWRLYAYRA